MSPVAPSTAAPTASRPDGPGGVEPEECPAEASRILRLSRADRRSRTACLKSSMGRDASAPLGSCRHGPSRTVAAC